MPTQKRWNRFSIVSAVLFVIAWVGANFYNHAVWLLTSKQSYDSLQEAGVSGLLEWIGVILPHVIVAILAFAAVRKIKTTGEKGKILSWAVLILAILSILLWTTTVFGGNSSIRELFTGDSYLQSSGNGPNDEAARISGRDTKKVADMAMIRSFLQGFYSTNGRYPRDQAEIAAAATSLPRKDWDVEYASINNGSSYVLRVQLEADSLGRLNQSDEKDGMQGPFDCNDASGYLCYTP